MLTIEETAAIEEVISFREAGNSLSAPGSLLLLQQFHNMTDVELERHIDYYKRAIYKYYNGTANYSRLSEEMRVHATEFRADRKR